MKDSASHIPEALRDVFSALTGKNRSELISLKQLSEEELKMVAGGRGYEGNVHRYSLS